MYLLTQDELDIVFRGHKLWLYGEKSGQRAVLHGADLSNLDLCGIDLRGADMDNTNLKNTNLSYADLRGASMKNTNLEGSNLSWAFGNDRKILTYLVGYHINITDDQVWIEDHHHTWEEWLAFSDDEIGDMNLSVGRSREKNLELWHNWKPALSRAIEERAAQRASINENTPGDAVTPSI